MNRFENAATPSRPVVRTVVPPRVRVPPLRRDSVTGLLVSALLKASTIFTATGGVNTAPALVTEGASCWKVMVNGAGRMTSNLLAEVRPAEDAVTVLLPATVITRLRKVAEPFGSVVRLVVPPAKMLVLKVSPIGTPLPATLLLN